MINHFLLPPKDRLRHWTNFRRSLSAMDDPDRLAAVADYFKHAPLLKMAHDPEQPETWPTPWEMVSAGDWCSSTVAIGMEMTLRLADIDPQRTELRLLRSDEISDQRMVLIIDSSHTLNYFWGRVYDQPLAPHSILSRWRFGGKAYVSI